MLACSRETSVKGNKKQGQWQSRETMGWTHMPARRGQPDSSPLSCWRGAAASPPRSAPHFCSSPMPSCFLIYLEAA